MPFYTSSQVVGRVGPGDLDAPYRRIWWTDEKENPCAGGRPTEHSTQGRTSRTRLHSLHLRLPLSKAPAAQTRGALAEFILMMEGRQSSSEISRKGWSSSGWKG